jgi:hypothetical protein
MPPEMQGARYAEREFGLDLTRQDLEVILHGGEAGGFFAHLGSGAALNLYCHNAYVKQGACKNVFAPLPLDCAQAPG